MPQETPPPQPHPTQRHQPVTSEPRDWIVRPVSRADADAARQLLARAFPGTEPPSRAHWDWLHASDPDPGRAYLVAEADGRLVSQYAAVPLRLQHAGHVVEGLLTVDAATDPDYAHRGLFTRLAAETHARTHDWAQIEFAFPNPASAPIFFQRLGWRELRPFPLLVRPLLGLRALEARRPRRLPADVEIGPTTTWDGWADALWEELAPTLGTAVVRDGAYLGWRYLHSPIDYDARVAYRRGTAVGFAVTREATVRGRRVTWLMELLAVPGRRDAARALLHDALRRAARRGSLALLAIATRSHPHRKLLRRGGFLPAPPRLTGSLTFAANAAGGAVDGRRLAELDAWHLSAADLDFL